LKTEQIYGNKLISEQMEQDIFEFIEIWYNRKEHSALDYKTIEESGNKNNFKNVATNIAGLICI
jgi:hypothetical protein